MKMTDVATATPTPDKLDIEAVLGLDAPGNESAWQNRRWWIIAGTVLFVFAALLSVWIVGGSADRLRYITETVTRGDLTILVTATGSVQPTNTVDVSSELSGTIRKVLVDYNDRVKVGQVLAELDTDKLKASVESARARLLAARAKIKDAEATAMEKKLLLERKEKLATKQVSSINDLDIARAAFARAVAAVESARADAAAAAADLKLNQTNLGKSCICSPISGIVLKRNVEPGQIVASSLQAPILFQLAEDLTKMEVQVDVDEADIGTVKEGQRATFTVDAYPGRKFSAHIRELRFGSEVVQGVVTYKAILSTENSNLLLRPGMTATAEITVQELKNVISAPNEALRFEPPAAAQSKDHRTLLERLLPGRPRFRQPSARAQTGNQRTIWRLIDGDLQRVNVTIGPTDGRRTQLIEGTVEAGQAVVVDTVTTNH